MINSEDVLLWFGGLDGFKRVDLMYQLLNMCVPFEVRFLGTCIEELGKHSYQELRGSFITANDVDKLNKDVSLTNNILDDNVRHRVMIYMSLLTGTNSKCADWYYKMLFQTDCVKSCVVQRSCRDDEFKKEFLLMFTLGLHHPAFTFEQTRFFGEMLNSVLNKRECIKTEPIRNYSSYGLAYSDMQKVPGVPVSHVPVLQPASISTTCQTDSLQQPAQNVIPHNIPTIDLMYLWNRPGFPAHISGAPEMPPFPVTSVSPLLSQPTSPIPSRPDSPHRFSFIQNNMVSVPPTNQVVEVIPMYAPDSLLQARLSTTCSENSLPSQVSEDKVPNCTNPLMVRVNNMKPPNGVRMNSFNKMYQNSSVEQMQALNLDGDYPHQCSSSNSSSNNSVNHSPSNTPPTVPIVSQQSPNRDNKNRINGGPIPYVNPNLVSVPPPPICDTSTPPPPLPAPLNNCSVPYPSNYPTPVTLSAITNRSVFNYSQPYRPPFSAPYSYQPSELIYFPFMVSNAISQIPPKNCYNCGAEGHSGPECTGQTIEEITQKKTYMLDYNSKVSEYDK